MSDEYKPDVRGLSKKGKKDYPRFTREEIEVPFCEICKGIKTVKKYQIIKRSGKTDEIYLCDLHKVAPEGVELICLEETKQENEDSIEFKEETEEQDDTLLV